MGKKDPMPKPPNPQEPLKTSLGEAIFWSVVIIIAGGTVCFFVLYKLLEYLVLNLCGV